MCGARVQRTNGPRSMTQALSRTNVTLSDRYEVDEGDVILNGTQALVRMLLTQRRLDRSRGLRTGMYVSGYPGSPLGGLDLEIARSKKHFDDDFVFQPAVNEELAATAVAGTQLIEQTRGRRVDGVTGFWYGKTPGLDRATDAIRHANTAGTSHLGGAVALVGDDPMSKSSTIPGASESICRSLMMPLFAPSNLAEIVELGLHAVAMSRTTGLWTALKVVSDLADSSAVTTFKDTFDAVPPAPTASRGKSPVLLATNSVKAEADLVTTRWAKVAAYSRNVGLNRAVNDVQHPELVIVSAGGAYSTLRRALIELDASLDDLAAANVRLVQLRMPWPLTAHDAEQLFADAQRVFVIEDKTPFVETQLKELLYGAVDAPVILGKADADGALLLDAFGALTADDIKKALHRVLPGELLPAPATPAVTPDRRALPVPLTVLPARTAFFCSGCPHNISTKAGSDELVGAGIGCHALVMVDPAQARGNILGAPQMGGEGAHWFGIAPFTTDRHFSQNIGDGTFHHSGSLAVRAAVAAGVTMTFKVLYNDAVAMTGGQSASGRLSVPDLARWLELEGVQRVVITTPEPRGYARSSLGPNTTVRHRDDFDEVAADLAKVDGVTVIIHDDRCATEERRMRKRDLLPIVTERVWINERVCEGCGDCGEKSSCLSVAPVETEFGRKTQIHQASCNSDMSCLHGDCPSFVMVDVPDKPVKRKPPKLPVALTPPQPRFDTSDFLIRMPGVGGTGVVTTSAIVQMAAMLDGKYAAGLDQTGLAQKGGPVVSDVRIAHQPIDAGVRASSGSVAVLLGLDPIGAASPTTLETCSPARTIAVVNTGALTTASMAVDTATPPLRREDVRATVDAGTLGDANVYVDALHLSEALFGDHMPANLVLLGAAYQHGCLPVSEQSIMKAIEMNGTGASNNAAAFNWGRALVIDEHTVLEAAGLRPTDPIPVRDASRKMIADASISDAVREVVARLADDLVDYQSTSYAQSFVDSVAEFNRAETRTLGADASDLTAAYARGLHHLMAYKDEYEVARLHLLPSERERIRREFGPNAKASIMLHPPLLRALGLKHKIRLGPWFLPALFVLAHLKRVRGTRLDLFGYAKVRRTERSLIQEYRAAASAAITTVTADNTDDVRTVLDAAFEVRGYEHVKLRNVDRFHETVAAALARLGSAS
ncbi:indolepyruvate ferredoxin oxidoreductase family protein [Amycolatopsis sp. 3B14]|uniref:indolepyruvate ferredoxin oxidoreductase family protein n=1 Tax=Amycolatopsis sp. 3B14 TaxID=3243600 RepID=UPI003D99A1A8